MVTLDANNEAKDGSIALLEVKTVLVLGPLLFPLPLIPASAASALFRDRFPIFEAQLGGFP